jgi:16S rRNA (uracil1498-N3)-methyltransferase
MNIIIISQDDFISQHSVKLSDYRHHHIKNIHRANQHDTLTIGLLNGDIGQGHITDITDQHVTLNIEYQQSPPSPLPITLIIALPRPKMIKRILQTCATMGVKKIIFMNSYRVEKSYWQTPLLQPEKIKEQLVLGLEQGKDTILPDVFIEQRFKPFVEDRLPNICKDTLAFVAHPHSDKHCPHSITTPTTLVIGPEGGFIPYEIEKLQEAGCSTIHLGARILRVETAIPVLLAKLFD